MLVLVDYGYIIYYTCEPYYEKKKKKRRQHFFFNLEKYNDKIKKVKKLKIEKVIHRVDLEIGIVVELKRWLSYKLNIVT